MDALKIPPAVLFLHQALALLPAHTAGALPLAGK